MAGNEPMEHKASDRIIVADLEVFYRVGVPADERANPQRLLLTIELDQAFTAAALSDDISKTTDYHAVAQRLLGFGEGRSWKLIETLAVDVANMLLKDFNVTSVTVEVKKFIIPQAKHVAVRVARNR